MFLSSSVGFSQQPLRFEHLSTENGLSHNQLFSICQDREGFMWFGTADGLNRYDGYTFTVFKPDPGDPNNHMGYNVVWDILETRAGELWFATTDEGLHRLNKRTGQINYFRLDPNRLSDRNMCYTLAEDRQGFLWVGTEGGLNRFDPRTKQFVLYKMPVDETDRRIWSVLEDHSGTLWVGTANGLFTFNWQTGQFTRYALDPAHPGLKHTIESLYQTADHTLWVASKQNALYRLIPAIADSTLVSETPTAYTPSRQVDLSKIEIFPNGLLEDVDHTLLLGTTSGLIRLNPRTGSLVVNRANSIERGSLSHDLVWALFRDQRGTSWIGTSNGIDKTSTLAPKFTLYQSVPDKTTARLENNILTLAEDRQGIIWFSTSMTTDHQGLFRLDRRTNQLTNFSSQTPAANRVKTNLPNQPITALFIDHHGTIWVATPGGLHAMNAVTHQFTHYPASFTIMDIDEDRRGNLWVGGEHCLARFDPRTGRYTSYCHDPKSPASLGGNLINDILVSRSGDVWIAFDRLGVSKLNPATGRVTRYHPTYSAKEKILFRRDVLALCETPDGAMWVATNMGGIFRIDPKTEQITTFTTHDGLPDNRVVALTSDQAGMLWLSTHQGLCRFDPVTKAVRVFDEKDGLQSKEFTRAHTRGPQGELVVGCTNGFQTFQPTRLRTNPFPPPVYITQVNVLDSVRTTSKEPLELAYWENVISLDFVALNYVASQKNQYAYQLAGANESWVYCGAQRRATYSFLAPGHYVFRVKAANNDGVWNTEGASLTLIIHPPWWRTWWAYSLYGIVLIGLLWGLMSYRSQALRRENARLENKVAHRTQQVLVQTEEIKAQRDHLAQTLTELQTTQRQLIQREKMASLGELTAGIAHEIQNPLNFVNNFSDMSAELIKEVRQEEVKPDPDATLIADLMTDLEANLRRISRHGQRAAGIVQGMLEHARSESSERRPTDLNALVTEQLKLAYHGMRAKVTNRTAKPLDFTCTLVQHLDDTLPNVLLSTQDMSRVLLNLFSNAFYALAEKQKQHQHTRHPSVYQPTLTVTTSQHTDTVGERTVVIRVADNGTGMPELVQAKLFQPFFTTKPTGEGTGLGLSLSYDIVTKGHGGTLTVKSQLADGTEFIVQLPA